MAQNSVNDAIAALKAGNKEEARALLLAILDDEPKNEDAWLVLSAAVDDPRRKLQCLETVLEINPDNQVARRGLERLQPPAEQIQEAAAEPPAPPDAAVAAATDPQPAEPAPPAQGDDAPPLPSFEQTTAATDVEAPLEAAAAAPAPPDAVAAAETPPPDAQDVAASAARQRQRRLVAIIGIVVGALLLLMIVVFAILLYMARAGGI